MSKKRKMERMSFLDASKSDLIDRIIWLRTNQGKEPNEEDLKGLDEEALIRLLVVLEENGLGGLTTMSLDTNFPWRNQKLLEFYNRKQMETEHEATSWGKQENVQPQEKEVAGRQIGTYRSGGQSNMLWKFVVQ